MKFGMQAILTAVPNEGNALAKIMLEAASTVAPVKGCERYIVQQSLTDDTKILITEVWASQEDHQASLSNEQVQALIARAKPIIATMEYHPAQFLGGYGC